MINLKKLSSAIATGAVLASVMAPGAFASTIDVSGNGAFSRNDVNSSMSNSTTLVQSNDSRVSNDVSVSNSTGGNSSSYNTGGSSSILTGNAGAAVDITNGGNTNIATLPSCGCNQSSDVSVSGNGVGSYNAVDLNSSNDSFYGQTNSNDTTNNVGVTNSTGDNHGSYNTGSSNNWNPLFNQNMNMGDYWNWYQQQHMSNMMDWNQFSNWFNMIHNNNGNSMGNSQTTTGDAMSDVTIQNMGSTNILH